jgi:membrane dipeptidase
MRRLTALLALALPATMAAQRPMSADDSLLARAREIHKRVVTIDTHVDIPYQYATEFADPGKKDTFKVDYPKMKAGGLDAVFFIVYVAQGGRNGEQAETARELALTKFASIRRAVATYKDRIALAEKASDVEKIARAGKLVAMIGIENGYVIGKDLGLLAKYQKLGARYMTLTHNGTNEIGDPSINIPGDKPNEWGGLSPFGRQVVAEMNRVGIMVDISHNGKATMMQATAMSKAPVIASHSGIKALSDHARNLDDEQLDAIKANGGVVQVVALGGFLKRPTPRDSSPATVKDLVDHIDYAVKRIGIDHVGISSDFDGGGGIVGWNDASETFNVTLELVKRGYSASDIEKIWGGNLIRVWKATEAAAKQLQAVKP